MDAHGIVHIFCMVDFILVSLNGRDQVGRIETQVGEYRCIGMQSHLLLCQWCQQNVQFVEESIMDQECVECIAYAHTSGLAIVNDAGCHVQIGRGCHIGVHHSCSCLYHGDTCGVAYKFNEFLASSGDAYIYVASGFQHLGCGFVGGRKQGGCRMGQAMSLQNLVYQIHDGLVGYVGIFTSLEYAGIATLHAQREYIKGYIGTCLIHHAYHSERYTHAAQPKSVGEDTFFQSDVQRRLQDGHMAHVLGYGSQSL